MRKEKESVTCNVVRSIWFPLLFSLCMRYTNTRTCNAFSRHIEELSDSRVTLEYGSAVYHENGWTALASAATDVGWIGNWIAFCAHILEKKETESERYRFNSLHFIGFIQLAWPTTFTSDSPSNERGDVSPAIFEKSLTVVFVWWFKFRNASHWVDSRSVNVA